LKTTAYISAANISFTALDSYGRRDVNRAVFKLDNVEAKPGKLWERTKHWTVDDAVIGGGIVGAFLALNPRSLPGITGWKRFLGAATVGCALGSYAGLSGLARNSAPLFSMMVMTEPQIRDKQYDRLLQDAKAQEALSRVGKVALAWYTWPIFRLSINPFQAQSKPEAVDASGGMTGNAHAGVTQQEMDQYDLLQLEFRKGELKGPDIEASFRAYKDSLADRDTSALQDWLEHLQELRKSTSCEAQYVWAHLTTREREFYKLQTDDGEKDIFRRELQMLNNLAFNLALREVVFAYHIADAHKRLGQLQQEEPVSADLQLDSSSMQVGLPKDWQDRHSPQLVAEQVRYTWTKQKELIGLLEQSAALFENLKPEPGTPHDIQIKKFHEEIGYMKKNVEATERLLKDFEEKLRRAEEYVEKATKSADS
jgi:hypothetical protein